MTLLAVRAISQRCSCRDQDLFDVCPMCGDRGSVDVHVIGVLTPADLPNPPPKQKMCPEQKVMITAMSILASNMILQFLVLILT